MVKEIVNLLNDFWNQFLRYTTGYLILPKNLIIFKSKESNANSIKISLIEKISFIDCPCKDIGKPINIALDYCLEFKNDGSKNPKIIKSCAKVVYFLNNYDISCNILILRFDYHPWVGSTDGDPLFHLQMDTEPIEKSWLPEPLLKKWPDTFSEIISQYKNHIRVPTPRMFFPDLMYFIVADHLRSSVYDLIEKTKDTAKKFNSFLYDESVRKERRFWEFVHTGYWYQNLDKLINKE